MLTELIEEIEAYCIQAGIAESTFGKKAMGDGKFVKSLRGGRRMYPENIDRVRSYMRDNPPKDGEQPGSNLLPETLAAPAASSPFHATERGNEEEAKP